MLPAICRPENRPGFIGRVHRKFLRTITLRHVASAVLGWGLCWMAPKLPCRSGILPLSRNGVGGAITVASKPRDYVANVPSFKLSKRAGGLLGKGHALRHL